MRSLYFSIALAMVGALALSLLVFTAISNRVEKTYINPVFEAMDQLQLENAQSAWDKDVRLLSRPTWTI
jgi:ABC-type lipoprotein release transport system permease subunit